MTEKRIIHAHPSVLIVKSQNTNELFMSVYDEGYKLECFGGSANLLGGNPTSEDGQQGSPLQTLQREVDEEISKTSNDKVIGPQLLWANEQDISYVRENIIQNIVPYSDFYFITDKSLRNGEIDHNAIFSTFYSEISQDVIECAKYNINSGRRLGPEGLIGVFSLEMLASQENPFVTAHATSLILKDRFEIDISYPKDLMQIKKLGTPKDSYLDYHSMFEHDKICWRDGFFE